MAGMKMKVVKCPTDELSFTNCVSLNPSDFPENVKYIEVTTGPNQNFVFNIQTSHEIRSGTAGFNLLQRKWASLILNQDIDVRPYHFDPSNSEFLCTIALEVDFLQKTTSSIEPYDTEQMAKDFLRQFSGQAFTIGQTLAFQFSDKKMLGLVVKNLEAVDTSAMKSGQESKSKTTHMGRCLHDTSILFKKASKSSLNLIGSAQDETTPPTKF